MEATKVYRTFSGSAALSLCVCERPLLRAPSAWAGSARPGVSESRSRLTLCWTPVSRRGMQPPTTRRPTFYTSNIFIHCVETDYVIVKQCHFLANFQEPVPGGGFLFKRVSLWRRAYLKVDGVLLVYQSRREPPPKNFLVNCLFYYA